MKRNTLGFSIIEILVGMVIFTIGLTGVYVLILSSMNLNDYSKNSIIALNLAKETIENVRNLRDNNYRNLYKWNKLPGPDPNNLFSTGVYYKVENDYSDLSVDTVKFDIIPNFSEGRRFISNEMQNYRLCLDNKNRYTYDCGNGNKKTHFYRYLKIDDVWDGSTYITGALRLTSKVIWYSRGYHEIELKTVLTDYLRQ